MNRPLRLWGGHWALTCCGATIFSPIGTIFPIYSKKKLPNTSFVGKLIQVKPSPFLEKQLTPRYFTFFILLEAVEHTFQSY